MGIEFREKEGPQTKRDREVAILAKQAEDRLAKYETNRKLLLDGYDRFVADKTNERLVAQHGIDWAEPGFVIELYVLDLKENAKALPLDDDMFIKPTPYAKILSVSPHNDPKRAWNVGDIVFMGDLVANFKLSPKWEHWSFGGKSNAKNDDPEPPKYWKYIYQWIESGKLYYPDKAKYILTPELALLTQENMNTFRGPYVFAIEPYEAKWRETGNPWAE